MKSHLAALLIASLTQRALGHQVHGILLVNNTESPFWKYVRDVGKTWEGPSPDRGYSDVAKIDPQVDIAHPDITCGRSAFDSASKTETADVLAGSEVGFRVSWDGNGEYGVFWHQGPGQVYLSPAPNGDLEHYRGDGDWFKIAYAGPVGNNEWMLWGIGKPVHEFNFTIPQTTPPGKYLMRIEQFMPTPSANYTQWYVNCAHVNIIGPGGGTPSGFARFPGTYNISDPGLSIPQNQFVRGGYVADEDMRLLEYKPPGPAVWTD